MWQQYLSDSVRNHFAEVDHEELRATTSILVQFWRLTEEQKRAVHAVSLRGDFLSKGAARTGKTLLLLTALAKATAGDSGQTLTFGNRNPSVVLPTITRALVKYDRYISLLLNFDETEQEVSTADRYIASEIRAAGIDVEVDYQCLEEFAREESLGRARGYYAPQA